MWMLVTDDGRVLAKTDDLYEAWLLEDMIVGTKIELSC